MTNPERFGTGLIRFAVYTKVDEFAIKKRSSLVANPEFKVRTLYPNTFESGKCCSVNDSLTNLDIFRVLSCTS